MTTCPYPLFLGQIFKNGQFVQNQKDQILCLGQKGEVVFRSRSRSKTLNSLFLAGETLYRPENYIFGNEFRRRSCPYPLFQGQIFKNGQFIKNKSKKKVYVQNFFHIRILKWPKIARIAPIWTIFGQN